MDLTIHWPTAARRVPLRLAQHSPRGSRVPLDLGGEVRHVVLRGLPHSINARLALQTEYSALLVYSIWKRARGFGENALVHGVKRNHF